MATYRYSFKTSLIDIFRLDCLKPENSGYQKAITIRNREVGLIRLTD